MKMMIFRIVAVFCCLAQFVFSQNSRILVGIEAGPAVSNLKGSGGAGFSDFRLGPAGVIGVSLQYFINDHVSLKTGLNCEMKGARLEYRVTDHTGLEMYTMRLSHNLGYMAVPFLVRVQTGEKMKLFANAGPYFGFLFGRPSQFMVPHSYHNYDAGGSIGGGASFEISSRILFTTEVRYSHGFMNINDGSTAPGQLITKSTALLLGIAWRPGKE